MLCTTSKTDSPCTALGLYLQTLGIDFSQITYDSLSLLTKRMISLSNDSSEPPLCLYVTYSWLSDSSRGIVHY